MSAQDVIAILDALAQRLGTTAEYLIPLYARRQVGGAIAQLVVLAIVSIAGYRAWNWIPSEEAMDDSDGMAIPVKWGIILILGIVGSVLLVGAVSTLASPEAAAISDLLGALRGK